MSAFGFGLLMSSFLRFLHLLGHDRIADFQPIVLKSNVICASYRNSSTLNYYFPNFLEKSIKVYTNS